MNTALLVYVTKSKNRITGKEYIQTSSTISHEVDAERMTSISYFKEVYDALRLTIKETISKEGHELISISILDWKKMTP